MALIEFEEYKQKLTALQPAIEELGQAYDLEHAAEEVEELENRASEPGFWDDMENSQKILQRTKALKDKIEGYHHLCAQHEDLLTLCDLAIEMEDESMLGELNPGRNSRLDGLLSDDLERIAPSCAYFTDSSRRQLFSAGSHAGNRRRYRSGYSSGGYRHAGLPFLRRGWSAHQQDLIREIYPLKK